MKKDKNQIMSDKLADMWDDLSDKARGVIADTDIGAYDEVFNGLNTPKEVNMFVERYYTEEA